MSDRKIISFHHSAENLKPIQFCRAVKEGRTDTAHSVTHLFYLYFILDGDGWLDGRDGVEGRRADCRFGKSDILCLYPGVSGTFHFEGRHSEWCWLSIEVGNNREFGRWKEMSGQITVLEGGIHAEVGDLLELLNDETLEERGSAYRVMGLMYTLVDAVFAQTLRTQLKELSGSGDLESVTRAVEYINLNYYHKIDVDSICRYVNYSRYYFSRRFKEMQGLSITEYINKVRLDRAVYLLSHTDLNILQVAKSVGFEDPYYFSRRFKSYTGITPSAFRENCRS